MTFRIPSVATLSFSPSLGRARSPSHSSETDFSLSTAPPPPPGEERGEEEKVDRERRAPHEHDTCDDEDDEEVEEKRDETRQMGEEAMRLVHQAREALLLRPSDAKALHVDPSRGTHPGARLSHIDVQRMAQGAPLRAALLSPPHGETTTIGMMSRSLKRVNAQPHALRGDGASARSRLLSGAPHQGNREERIEDQDQNQGEGGEGSLL